MSPPSGQIQGLSPVVFQVGMAVHVFRGQHGRIPGGIDEVDISVVVWSRLDDEVAFFIHVDRRAPVGSDERLSGSLSGISVVIQRPVGSTGRIIVKIVTTGSRD